jgi:hypothetical protein
MPARPSRARSRFTCVARDPRLSAGRRRIAGRSTSLHRWRLSSCSRVRAFGRVSRSIARGVRGRGGSASSWPHFGGPGRPCGCAPLGDEAVGVGRPVTRERLGDNRLQLPLLEGRYQRLNHPVQAFISVPAGDHVEAKDALSSFITPSPFHRCIERALGPGPQRSRDAAILPGLHLRRRVHDRPARLSVATALRARYASVLPEGPRSPNSSPGADGGQHLAVAQLTRFMWRNRRNYWQRNAPPAAG